MSPVLVASFRFQISATLTKPMSAGTSTNGPTTAVNATPDAKPKTPTATAKEYI